MCVKGIFLHTGVNGGTHPFPILTYSFPILTDIDDYSESAESVGDQPCPLCV